MFPHPHHRNHFQRGNNYLLTWRLWLTKEYSKWNEGFPRDLAKFNLHLRQKSIKLPLGILRIFSKFPIYIHHMKILNREIFPILSINFNLSNFNWGWNSVVLSEIISVGDLKEILRIGSVHQTFCIIFSWCVSKWSLFSGCNLGFLFTYVHPSDTFLNVRWCRPQSWIFLEHILGFTLKIQQYVVN